MERAYPSSEYDVVVDGEGKILLPRHLRAKLKPGSRLTIRITEGVVSDTLRRRNVTETEIETIARRQLESRDQVIEFLSAEGALARRRRFARRAKNMLRV